MSVSKAYIKFVRYERNVQKKRGGGGGVNVLQRGGKGERWRSENGGEVHQCHLETKDVIPEQQKHTHAA